MTAPSRNRTLPLRKRLKAAIAVVVSAVVALSGITPAHAATKSQGNCVATVNNISGVDVFENGLYCYVAFKGAGTTYSWTPPNGVNSIDLLVVAGGGGGGTGSRGRW